MAGRVTVGVDFIANFDGSKLSSQFKSAMNGFKVPKDLFDVSSNIKQLQNALKTMKLPSDMSASFTTQFNSLEKELLHYQDLLNRPVKTKADVSALEKSSNKIHQLFNNIITDIGKINSTKIKSNVDSSKLQEYQSRLKELKKEMASIGKEGLSKAFSNTENIDFYGGISKSKKANDLKTSIENAVKVGDIDTAKQKVLELEKVLNNLKAFKGNRDGVTKFKDDLISTLDSIKSKSSGAREGINEVSGAIKNLKQQGKLSVAEQLKTITEGANVSSEAVDKLASSYNNVAQNTYSKVQQVSDLKNQVQYFFGLQNQVFLFRRAVRDTIDTVKELDASMTETAVVTDFSVSDMWAQLPEYTAAANELGSTINDVYKANTLYFQQGLDSEQAMGLGVETLKMARIAGMDAAKATDLMTAALRGFNMELNQTSAQRVNDVYSKLAAITASDTQEIGTAVSKTASLASSAGMDLEETSALLAQVVETTREPPETAGTALKTIIARFGELKELFTQGQLTGEDENGEEIVVNRVDKALQTAGIDLKEFVAGNKGLGEVFVELSKKWGGLSTAQQRYIATQAAGARQQSRFIAMLQDTERLQYLLDEAYSANGASAIQFEKTQESVEAKTNKLKNAWDEFTMGFMNEKILKGGIDAFRVGLSAINDIIESISEKVKVVFGDGIGGIAKGALTFGTGFASLGVAGKAVNSLLGGLGGMITPGDSFLKGLKSGFVGGKDQEIINAINSFHSDYSGNIRAKGNLSKTNEEYRDFTRDDYVNKNKDLRELLKKEPKVKSKGVGIGSTTTFNTKEMMDSVNKVPPFYQNLLMKNNPGIAQAMERDFKEGFSKLNLSDAEKALALKHQKGFKEQFKKGETTFQDYIGKSFAPSKAVENYGAELGERIYRSSAKNFVNKYGLGEAAKKVKAYAEREGIGGHEALGRLLDEEALNKQVQFKGADNLVQKFSKVGSAVSSAGVSVNQFGVSLQAMGFEKAGAAAQRFGNIIMGLGPAINSLGQIPELFAKANPMALAFGGIATIAGAAVLGIKKYQSNVRKEAEDIQKNYEKISKSATENIDKINSIKIDFSTLAKGVDEYGNNLTLNDTQYKDYIEDVEKLTQMAPELIKGYNAEGKAIIDKSKAIEIATKAQEKNLETAQKEYTSTESMDTMIQGIQYEKKFKKHKTKVSGNAPIGQSMRGFGTKEDSSAGVFLTKEVDGLRNALKAADVEIKNNQTKLINDLAGREINLYNPSPEDLKFISEHSRDIQNKIEAANMDMTESQRKQVNKSLTNLTKGWTDIQNEIQPLMQQTYQYLSREGFDIESGRIGEQFATAFKTGIEGISLRAVTEQWSGEQLQQVAKDLGTRFSTLTGKGSQYADIMKQVNEEQKNYVNYAGDIGAVDTYQSKVADLSNQLRGLATSMNDGTEAGKALAESFNYQADQIDNYAKETQYSLSNALNTMEGDFESAKGAYDNFSEAIKSGDYYTAAEGFNKMYDEVMDGVDDIGKGSQTFWKAAADYVDQGLLKKRDLSRTKAQMKEVHSWFEEGTAGVNNFAASLRKQDVQKTLEKAGRGHIIDVDKQGNLKLNITQDGDLEALARALGTSVDALSAAIDKSRQFVDIKTGDYEAARAAIAQDERAFKTDGATTKKGLIYYKEDLYRAESEQANGGDEKAVAADIKGIEEKQVKLIDLNKITSKKQSELFSNFVQDTGINRKTPLSDSVSTLMDMGFVEKDELTKFLQDDRLYGKGLEEPEIDKAIDEYNATKEVPSTITDIKSDTAGILSAAQAMLVDSGTMPDELKNKYSEEFSSENADKFVQDLKKANNDKDKARAYEDIKREQERAQGEIDAKKKERENAKTEKDRKNFDAVIKNLEGYKNRLEEGSSGFNKQDNEVYKTINGFLNEKGSNLKTTEKNSIKENSLEFYDAFNTRNLEKASGSLQQLIGKYNLSTDAAKALRQEFVQLRGTDLNKLTKTQFNSLLMQMGASKKEANQLRTSLSSLDSVKLSNIQNQVKKITGGAGKKAPTKKQVANANALQYVSKQDGSKESQKQTTNYLKKQGFDKKTINKTITLGVKISKLKGEDKEKVQEELDNVIKKGEKNGINIPVKADTSKADKKISNTEKKKKKASKKATIPFSANVSDANKKIKDTEKKKDKLKLPASFSINAHDNATGVISSIRSSISSFINDFVKNPIQATVNVVQKVVGGGGGKSKGKSKKGGNSWTGTRNTLPVNPSLSFNSAAEGQNNKAAKKINKNARPTLTGEKGYEVAWLPSQDRSTILGLKGPEFVNLPRDAVVYNHDQSKKIVKGNKKRPELGSMANTKGDERVRGPFGQMGLPSGGGKRRRNSGGSGDTNSGTNSGNNKGNKKSNSKNKGKFEDVLTVWKKLSGKVSVWWDNTLRKVEAATRRFTKAYDKFTKYISSPVATASDALKRAADAAKKGAQAVSFNIDAYKRADSELKEFDLGKKTKNQTDINKFIKLKNKKKKSKKDKKTYNNLKKKLKKKGFINKKGKLTKKGKRARQVGENWQTISYERKGTTYQGKGKKGKKYAKMYANFKRGKKKSKNRKALKKAGIINKKGKLTKKGKGLIKTKKVSKTKNEKVDFSKYVKLDKQSGSYVIDEKAIKKLAKKNKKKAEAIREKANEYIEDKQSKRNEAEDNLQEIREQFQSKGDEIYETFYSWKKELDEIQIISKAIANTQTKISIASSKTDHILNNLLAGFTKDIGKSATDLIETYAKNEALLDTKIYQAQQSRAAIREKEEKDYSTSDEQKAVDDATAEYNRITKELGNINTKSLTTEELEKMAADQSFLEKIITQQTALRKKEDAESELKIQEAVMAIAQQYQGTNEEYFYKIDLNKLESFGKSGDYTVDQLQEIESRINGLMDSSNDYLSTLSDEESAQNEKLDFLVKIRQELSDSSQTLAQALIDRDQRQIDKLTKINDTIKNQTSKILDDVKKSLDQKRQQENNQKTEKDISDKQRRLAYLQNDTAGGHQVEIAQLRKEIEDSQKNYQQSIEDQTLQNIQTQNEKAAEQRERQISLLQTQLEYNKEINSYAQEVDKMIAASYLTEETEEKAAEKKAALDKMKELLKESSLDGKQQTDITTRTIEGTVNQEITKLAADAATVYDPNYRKQVEQQAAEEKQKADAAAAAKAAEDKAKADEAARTAAAAAAQAAAEAVAKAQAEAKAKADADAKAKADADKAQAETDYRNAVARAASNEKIGAEELLKVQAKANAAGYSARTWMQDLANTGLKWKQIIPAAKAAGFSRYSLAKTFTSSAFISAYNDVYGKDAYKTNRKSTKGAAYSYKTGGLADYTGPAWLDGTKTKPELVLNAQDTRNFIALKDTLSSLQGRSFTNQSNGDLNFDIDINVEKIDNDYDVKKVASMVKQEIVKSANYRNVNIVRNMK